MIYIAQLVFEDDRDGYTLKVVTPGPQDGYISLHSRNGQTVKVARNQLETVWKCWE